MNNPLAIPEYKAELELRNKTGTGTGQKFIPYKGFHLMINAAASIIDIPLQI